MDTNIQHQKGFAQIIGLIILVVLLLTGVLVGVYLVLKPALYRAKASPNKNIYVSVINVNSKNGKFTAMEQARATPKNLLDASLYGPQVIYHTSGYSSEIYLINPNSESVKLSITLNEAISQMNATNNLKSITKEFTIPANGSLLINQQMMGASDGIYSAAINATSPITGYVESSKLLSSSKSPADSNDIFLNNLIPQKLVGTKVGNLKFYVDSYGWNSGHIVMNTSNQDVVVSLKVYDEVKKSLTATSSNVIIPPKSSLSIYAPIFKERFGATGVLQEQPGNAGFNGALVAEVVSPKGLKALASYYQIARPETDVISYVGMSEVEASNCNYMFPAYLDYGEDKYITGFTVQSFMDLKNVNYSWLSPNQQMDISSETPGIYDNLPAGVNKQNSFYKFESGNGPKSKNYIGTAFALKACAENNDTLITLFNSTNKDFSVAFGDAGMSEVWADSEIIAPLVKFKGEEQRLNTYKIFSPSSGDTPIKIDIINSLGQVVNSSIYLLKQNEIKDIVEWQQKWNLPSDFQGWIKISAYQ